MIVSRNTRPVDSNNNSSDSNNNLSDTANNNQEGPSSSHFTLEDCSNNYFAGYLAKTSLERYNNCPDCESMLIRDGIIDKQRDLLIIQKTYNISHLPRGGLKRPTTALVDIVEKSLKIINRYLNKTPHKRKIVKYLISKIFEKTNAGCLVKTEICKNHVQFLIKKMITVKILKECKWRLNSNKTGSSIRKIKILKSL